MSTLYVIATPIGNLEDISLRALRLFKELSVLACEDTRVTLKIFQRYEIPHPAQYFSYHEHNEQPAGRRIMQLLAAGTPVGLCSDGGCPAISDPGYRIINDALDAGFRVEVIPGPCAVETALMSSGMPTSSYTFLGFLPPKSGKRQNYLRKELESPHTLVIYEAPHRLEKLLEDALAVFGNRQTAVCVELTKKFERVHRAGLAELAGKFPAASMKGEIVVVIAGNNPKFRQDAQEEASDE